MTTPSKLDVDRVRDLTAEHLGASEYERIAFQMIALPWAMKAGVDEREAIASLSAGGGWRELLAELDG